MINKVVASDRARTNWRDMIDAALSGHDVVIERYGKPTVAVIPYEDYVALEETLQDIRDAREAQQILDEWRRDPTSVRPWKEVREELLTDSDLQDG